MKGDQSNRREAKRNVVRAAYDLISNSLNTTEYGPRAKEAKRTVLAELRRRYKGAFNDQQSMKALEDAGQLTIDTVLK